MNLERSEKQLASQKSEMKNLEEEARKMKIEFS